MLGVGLAALANLVAFSLAGAGHGWTTALLVSFSLWVTIPVALFASHSGSRAVLLVVLFIGLATDLALVRGTLMFGEDFALRSILHVPGGWMPIALWVGLLLFWQILAARRLLMWKAIDA